MRTWFFLDLISSIPLDYIFLIFNQDYSDSFQILHAGRALRILRFAKLLSLLRLVFYLKVVLFAKNPNDKCVSMCVLSIWNRLLRLSRLVRYVSTLEEAYVTRRSILHVSTVLSSVHRVSWLFCDRKDVTLNTHGHCFCHYTLLTGVSFLLPFLGPIHTRLTSFHPHPHPLPHPPLSFIHKWASVAVCRLILPAKPSPGTLLFALFSLAVVSCFIICLCRCVNCSLLLFHPTPLYHRCTAWLT